jgi:hypothetical protein
MWARTANDPLVCECRGPHRGPCTNNSRLPRSTRFVVHFTQAIADFSPYFRSFLLTFLLPHSPTRCAYPSVHLSSTTNVAIVKLQCPTSTFFSFLFILSLRSPLSLLTKRGKTYVNCFSTLHYFGFFFVFFHN